MSIDQLFTPCLVLDRRKLQSNINRLAERLNNMNVALRPHVKTVKSTDIGRMLTGPSQRGITVSTLKEAEYFAEHGFDDILYAVSIVPSKIPRVAALLEKGVTIHLVIDHADVAKQIAQLAQQLNVKLSVWIEVDCDGHRCGVAADSAELIQIGRVLCDHRSTHLAGIMIHAGESYECRDLAQITSMAQQEHHAAAMAAQRLRDAGLPCQHVSVGSTPTAHFAEDYAGVTEVRAGVYVFQDLFQANLGVCGLDDIAISVLCQVIGHQPRRNWLITDAGALALSKDRSTAGQSMDYQFGQVCDGIDCKPINGLHVIKANQEHGIISTAQEPIPFSRYPIGHRLRILPNHACLTAACFQQYHVIDGGHHVQAVWNRINGW